MSTLQQQAIQMICAMPDDKVRELIEIIRQRYPNSAGQSRAGREEKMEAFQDLEAWREALLRELPRSFDPEKELEEALIEKYGPVD